MHGKKYTPNILIFIAIFFSIIVLLVGVRLFRTWDIRDIFTISEILLSKGREGDIGALEKNTQHAATLELFGDTLYVRGATTGAILRSYSDSIAREHIDRVTKKIRLLSTTDSPDTQSLTGAMSDAVREAMKRIESDTEARATYVTIGTGYTDATRFTGLYQEIIDW